jgi:Rnl2 family RNA ligase
VGTWTFQNYEKIAESSDEWRLDEAAYRHLEKVSWVVTEKIHGANFCFVLDGQTIRCASRKHLLERDEDFFHYQVVLARLQETLWRMFRLVQSSYPQMSRASVYGELFGGSYPHPDVPPDPAVEPVQTGVWYCPSLEFCAFDLAIEGEAAGLPRTYVDYDQAISFFQTAGLFYAAPLLIGSYQEALAYPLGFRSTIPGLLGLPPLQEENRAEGVVIKPLKTIMLPTNKGSIRPVLKRKIAEFAEDKRFHQA